MALDIAGLKKMLNTHTTGTKGPFWKPPEGDTTIRIVPLEKSPTNPLTEVMFHYLDRNTKVSPATFGDPDPFIEESDARCRAGNLTKEEYREAKKLLPSSRFYVPVLVRGEESKGLQYWGFTATVLKELLVFMTSDDYDDITDIESGNDIRVTFTPGEKTPNKFAKTELFIRPKPSPLTTNPELLDKLLHNQPNLMDEFEASTYEELQKELEKIVAPVSGPTTPESTDDDDGWGAPAQKQSAGVVRGGKPSPTPAKPTRSSKVASDVEDEFADMFNS